MIFLFKSEFNKRDMRATTTSDRMKEKLAGTWHIRA